MPMTFAMSPMSVLPIMVREQCGEPGAGARAGRRQWPAALAPGLTRNVVTFTEGEPRTRRQPWEHSALFPANGHGPGR